jgi:hypothetical protein
MQRDIPHSNVRRVGAGPFFDYVLTHMHRHALRMRRMRAACAVREHRMGRSRQTSAEQRWEGEGGSMRECAPRGGRS